jgi:hypothetical protein
MNTVTTAYGLRNIIRGVGQVPAVISTGGTTAATP